jgi:hypothetical protein
MKFKKPNLASVSTPENKTATFKTANIHNASQVPHLVTVTDEYFVTLFVTLF